MKMRPHTEKIYDSLCEVIPGGVNSPVRACKSMEQLPLVAAYGNADMLFDVDQHSYIDLCCSWGALIHGHAHPAIVQAAQHRIALGTTFGVTTAIEGELARKMIAFVPSLEKVRFVSSGTEATMSAIRLARGFTKREVVVKCSGNYHGHADFFLVKAGSGVVGLPESSSAGIPSEMISNTLALPYNDVEKCREILRMDKWQNKIAAIIIEPIAGNMGVVPATLEFLKMLREETERLKALLIFDEVISGFRVAPGGAQELYGITPDLSCFGKIMGGGFPAAAFGGRKDIMEHLAPLGSVYQAGTLSGNPVAMEAGLQALSLLQKDDFYSELDRKANIVTQPVITLLKEKNIKACIQQVGSMFTLFFGRREVKNFDEALELDLPKYAQFFRYMFNKGIYIPPAQHEAWFISTAHTESHLEFVRDSILEFFNSLPEGQSINLHL